MDWGFSLISNPTTGPWVADGPLKWNQVSSSLATDPDSLEGAVGHCSFTSLDTVKPSFTKLYA